MPWDSNLVAYSNCLIFNISHDRKQAQLLAQKEVEQERETLGTSEIIYRLIMRSSVCNSYNYNQGAFERDHYSCKMQTKPGKRLYGLHL
jgi:hypothetical protein